MPPSESDDEAVFEPSAVINGVGLPKILQYKPESKQPQLDFSKLEVIFCREYVVEICTDLINFSTLYERIRSIANALEIFLGNQQCFQNFCIFSRCKD